MNISPFFLNLRSAYRSEMDDLSFDSEGRNVLNHRLAEKRREIGFLVQMMDVSPEMVAVIFHQSFVFGNPAAMDRLLSHEADEFPAWSQLSKDIELAPWASELADVILQAPRGEWFLTLAAGLHYMNGKPDAASVLQGRDDEDADEDGDDQDEFDADEDGNEAGDARSREEAGADWLAGQGFDRKD